MRLKIFCFDRALLKKNVVRYWPLWALFTATLVLTFFVRISNIDQEYYNCFENSSSYYTQSLLDYHAKLGAFLLLPYSILCAACCFGYLHRTRSAYMMHAFPVTRGSLFCTNYLSGLLFFLVPWLAVSAADTLSVALKCNSALALIVARSSALLVLEYLFFYGLAVFCMHFTGKTVYGVLSFLALNFVAVLVDELVRLLINPLLYGITLSDSIAELFSPVIALTILGGDPEWHLWVYAGALAAVGTALSVGAWLLYRKRHLESCGEAVAFPFLRPIFQYLLTLICALCLGLLMAAIILGDVYNSRGQLLPTVLLLLIGAFVGFFGAKMMLNRTLRVFRAKNWIGLAVFAALLAGGLTAVKYDWFRIVRYVPEAEEIESVSLSPDYQNSWLEITNPEQIETLLTMHEGLTEDLGLKRDYYNINSIPVNIIYHLKNGETVERGTYYASPKEKLTSVYAPLTGLLRDYELNLAYFDALYLERSVWIDVTSDDDRGLTLGTNEIAALNDCLLEDAAAGRITAYPEAFDEPIYFWLRAAIGTAEYGQTGLVPTICISVPSTATSTVTYLNSVLND